MMSDGRTVFGNRMQQAGDSRKGRSRTLAIVAVCQLSGAVVAYGGAILLSHVADIALPLAVVLLVWGLLAAAFGVRAGLASWWLVLQICFPLAAGVGIWLKLPAWAYLAAFGLLLATQWNAARGGVPLFLTNRQTHEAIRALLPDRHPMIVADIGSGLAGTLLSLAGVRLDGQFIGIETAPLPFALSWIRVWASGRSDRVRLIYGDYRHQDFSAFDVVYCFLSPIPMAEVYAKARREMRPGSLLISNSFTVPGHAADETVVVADRRGTQLHIWRF